MNQDCYFEIGHSHTICEDYALAGEINDKLSYAIVCDGCSSSDNVDVGARILAHSAKEYLCSRYANYNDIPDNLDAHEIGLSIITRAVPHIKVLMLPNTSLDATLIISLASEDKITTFFYGDGAMAYKCTDDIYYQEVEFPSGAPFYLSYLLDPSRENGYLTQLGRKAIVKYYQLQEDGLNQIGEKILDDLETPEFFKELAGGSCDSEWTAIMSDGIQTYQTTDEFGIQHDCPVEDAIKKVSAYKGFKGKFVERRMKRMRKNCEKEGITHYDDISIATIYAG